MEYLENGKIKVSSKEELQKIIKKCEIDLALIDIKASGITDFTNLFRRVKTINGTINRWDTSLVKNMTACFEGSEAIIDIKGWNFESLEQCNWMFWKATHIEKEYGKLDSGTKGLLVWLKENLIAEETIDDYLSQYDILLNEDELERE